MKGYNTFMGYRDHVIEDSELMRKAPVNFTKLESEIEIQTEELEAIAE